MQPIKHEVRTMHTCMHAGPSFGQVSMARAMRKPAACLKLLAGSRSGTRISGISYHEREAKLRRLLKKAEKQSVKDKTLAIAAHDAAMMAIKEKEEERKRREKSEELLNKILYAHHNIEGHLTSEQVIDAIKDAGIADVNTATATTTDVNAATTTVTITATKSRKKRKKSW